MESLTDAGLTVIYDEEAGIITFEWDEETHPEYNSLKELTDEKFSSIMMNFMEDYDKENPDPSPQPED